MDTPRSRRAFMACLTCLAGALLLISPWSAGAAVVNAPPILPRRSVWVDASTVDLSDKATVKRLMAIPMDRLIVTTFGDGATMIPITRSPFPVMVLYRHKAGVLRGLVKLCAALHIPVYAAFDCLRWSRSVRPGPGSVFARRPDLAERTADGACAVPTDGIYASPFNRKVGQILDQQLAAAVASCPGLAGVVLDCRLPRGVLLGYSGAAREAYIRATSLDPVDIPLNPSVEDRSLPEQWAGWRLDEVSSLVRGLANAARHASPHVRVATVGYADWYQLAMGPRNGTLSDWMGWLRSGSVDEVLLTGRWSSAVDADAYPRAVELLAKMAASGKIPQASMVISLRQAGTPQDPVEALMHQQGEPIRDMTLYVERSQDIHAAEDFFKNALPVLAPALGGYGASAAHSAVGGG